MLMTIDMVLEPIAVYSQYTILSIYTELKKTPFDSNEAPYFFAMTYFLSYRDLPET